MNDFRAALAAAKDTRDPEDYVRRVKSVIHSEINLIDPDAVVEDTRYFGHSAIPDFLVTWKREKSQRSVFLRDTLVNVVAARDTEFIPDDAPAVIALDDEPMEKHYRERLNAQIGQRPNALITSASTLDVLDEKGSPGSPLAELVRANFIKGAKGWVDSPEAKVLMAAGTVGESDHVAAVEAAVSKHFQSDAANRIGRAAQLLAMASSPAWTTAMEDNDLFRGQLSDGELRTLLPWVLKSGLTPEPRFWQKLGSMFSLTDLEKLHAELGGFDLSALVEANKKTWAATRAYVGLHIDEEGEAADQAGAWSFFGRVLGKSMPEVGSRIHVAYKGTKLPGRGSATSTTWEHLEPALLAYRLIRVELKGLRRSVTVNAEESDDIRQDISEIASSLEDTYFVQSVTVRTDSTDEGTVDTQIDFGKSLAVSTGDAVLGDLTQAVQDLLIRGRSPIEE